MRQEYVTMIKVELRALFLLTIAYFFLARGWAVTLGQFHWTIWVVVVSTLLWLGSLWGFHKHQNVATRTDRMMLYIPFGVWLLFFYIIKFITWQLARGGAYWHGYGEDKGLANMLYEPAFVACGAALYFSHWWFAKRHLDLRRPLLVASLLIAAIVPLVVPPIAD